MTSMLVHCTYMFASYNVSCNIFMSFNKQRIQFLGQRYNMNYEYQKKDPLLIKSGATYELS